MKTNTFPLEPEKFYHIYNRGVNGGALFFETRNYFYFLNLIQQKVLSVAKVYSYCLMENHFHMLVEIRAEKEIRTVFPHKQKDDILAIVSHQFSNVFNSYAQAINKCYSRTGKLFELPFRRKEILSESQLLRTILYINKNPEKHNAINGYRHYPYSSVGIITGNKDTFIEKHTVLDFFEGMDGFIKTIENYSVK